MKDKLYYKLISSGPGGLFSFNSSRNDRYSRDEHDTKLRYGVDILTVPKIPGSKLFIFDTEENALVYGQPYLIINNSSTELWTCRATGVSRPKAFDANTNFREFWELKKKHKKITVWGRGIVGTLFAQEVQLVEKIR